MLKSVSVILKIDNQRIEEEVKKIISSLDKFYVKACAELGPCDLLILEIGCNPKKEVHLLRSLRDSGWAPNVFSDLFPNGPGITHSMPEGPEPKKYSFFPLRKGSCARPF